VAPGPRRTPPTSDGASVLTRVVTALAVAGVAILCWAIGRGALLFLTVVIVGIAAVELSEAYRRAGYHVATALALFGSVALVLAAYDRGERAFPMVSALVVGFTFFWYLFEVVRARPTVNIALTLLVFSYIGLFGGFAGLLLAPDPDGPGFLMGVVLCAVAYDVMGWLVGSQFGRTRLLERVSPNKTTEGLIAGCIAAVVVGGVVGGVLAPWSDKGIGAGLALGALVAILAPLGDLCESMIKRDLGVKDLGTLLPGHGGVIDRFDAILFCLPAAYYLALALF
jgi:phosphatidate cytidylyltransferase